MENCIACGFSDIRFLIGRIDKYVYRYCANCSLVLSDPMPTQNELVAYYDGFMGGSVEAGSDFDYKLSSRKTIAKNYISWIRQVEPLFDPNGARLVDVGGGAGFFSEGFRLQGLLPTLIDIDPKACEYVRSTFQKNIETVNSDPIEADLLQEFDVVFMNQVIEHYVDPNALIQKAMTWLKPGGFLILTTPNQMSRFFWFSIHFFYDYLRKTSQKVLPMKSFIRFMKMPWICCDPPRHVYAFNPINMEFLLKKNGLRIVKILTEMNSFCRYVGKMHYRWTVKTPRDIISIFGKLYELGGSSLIHSLNPKKNWGHHVIALARKPG